MDPMSPTTTEASTDSSILPFKVAFNIMAHLDSTANVDYEPLSESNNSHVSVLENRYVDFRNSSQVRQARRNSRSLTVALH
jgi:hypothetical protein